MESFRNHVKKHQDQLSKEEFKCDKCSFQGENMVNINDHKEKYHITEHKCLVCGDTFVNMESFRKHAEIHKYKGQVSYFPGNSAFFNCNECKESFKSHDYMMNHLSEVHLTEAQRQGAGLAKYNGRAEGRENIRERRALCRNGVECWFYQNYRCRFFHPQRPQAQQRHVRQTPSDEWQQVPSLRPDHNQQGQVQHPQEQVAQVHKYWSVPPQGDSSKPWCLHGDRCPMGKYCVLRHESLDFPNGKHQRWN